MALITRDTYLGPGRRAPRITTKCHNGATAKYTKPPARCSSHAKICLPVRGQKQFDDSNQTFDFWQIFLFFVRCRLVGSGALAIAHLLFPPHLNSNYVPEWLFRSPLNRRPLANGCKFCLIQSWLWIERESSTFFCHVGHVSKTLIIHKLSRLWRQPTLIVGSPACN